VSEPDLKALYLAHREELQAYLNRQVRCRETAADLTQDVFIRLSEQAGRSRIGNFRAYLFSSVRNLLIDHFRREQHRKGEDVPEAELESLAQITPSLEQTVMAQQELQQLQVLVQNMPVRCREVFLLSRLEGLTFVEIGARLGISSKTAFSHMVRALEIIKQGMPEQPAARKGER
jgi:RNA polymerase sigma factor (sigma-70 family)